MREFDKDKNQKIRMKERMKSITALNKYDPNQMTMSGLAASKGDHLNRIILDSNVNEQSKE